jgi:hypothetical protein
MHNLAEIFVPISFFALIGLILYFTMRYNYQIKKTILEKGGSIEVAKKRFPLLEIGLSLIGLGLGLAVSVIPQSTNLPKDSKGLLTAACILLFGGLGLISAFIIRRKIEKQ